ncbi:protein of unknown function [Thermosyntropha lipolytica DSM 11003]|uniref:HTH cro/C1-type domain-containing protein n=1 Tax=Thermosyntropha lipolytica DSM 11003 TaxID=1123382 RepID=A0A1M5RFZ8_9FIRM|nr:RodZ domain-containing protein [Thermosyntropha lipolytica]SHH25050.1 protein of unknown function [Thermosyntropha lipolytica DSM 11003]
MGVGAKLKEAREKKGLTLEMVEEETKIRKSYLEALENENFSILPPRVYAVGFVRRYAKTLGLDEEELVREFKALAYAGEKEEEDFWQEEKKEEGPRFDVSKLPWSNVFLGLAFLVLVIWLGNFLVGYFAQKATEEREPVLPPPVVEKEEKKEPPLPEVKEAEKAKPVYNGVNLAIEARQNCWLSVKVDGNEAFTGIIKPGEKKVFDGQEEIYVKAGNAGGIDVTFNGEKIGVLGEVGQVVDKTFTREIGKDEKKEKQG